MEEKNQSVEKTSQVEKVFDEVVDLINRKLVFDSYIKLNYVFLVLGIFMFPTVIMAIVVAYFYRMKAKNMNAEKYVIDNFTWQIRTCLGVCGIWLLSIFFFSTFSGFIILYLSGCAWLIYRVIKGWQAYSLKNSIYNKKGE